MTTVDGSSILLRTIEIEELAKIVPKECRDRLKLPTIMLRRMEMGKSVYTVAGDHLEESTIKRILDMIGYDYREL